jgi:ABC-type phosphate transport system permease subunit
MFDEWRQNAIPPKKLLMKVYYLAIKFTSFMTPFGTKHGSFPSFGSHAFLFCSGFAIAISGSSFLLSNESIIYLLFSVYISIYQNPYKTKSKMTPLPKYLFSSSKPLFFL